MTVPTLKVGEDLSLDTDVTSVLIPRHVMIRLHKLRTEGDPYGMKSDKVAELTGARMGTTTVKPLSKKIRRRSKKAIELLEELNFNPMVQSVEIAKGNLYKENHWWRPIFENKMDIILEALSNITPSNIYTSVAELQNLLVNLLEDGLQSLLKYQTPIGLRSQHTMELMNYIYPKMKSIEHVVTDTDDDKTELTVNEMQQFKDVFENTFMQGASPCVTNAVEHVDD